MSSSTRIGDDDAGRFFVRCRDKGCGQSFTLTRDIQDDKIFWAAHNGEHSFRFFERAEYLMIKNSVMNEVPEQMFCYRFHSGIKLRG